MVNLKAWGGRQMGYDRWERPRENKRDSIPTLDRMIRGPGRREDQSLRPKAATTHWSLSLREGVNEQRIYFPVWAEMGSSCYSALDHPVDHRGEVTFSQFQRDHLH